MTRLRCAILDDYLNVALSVADWSKVQDRVDVTVFNQPFATAEAAAHALKDFEIICAMRAAGGSVSVTANDSAAAPDTRQNSTRNANQAFFAG